MPTKPEVTVLRARIRGVMERKRRANPNRRTKAMKAAEHRRVYPTGRFSHDEVKQAIAIYEADDKPVAVSVLKKLANTKLRHRDSISRGQAPEEAKTLLDAVRSQLYVDRGASDDVPVTSA